MGFSSSATAAAVVDIVFTKHYRHQVQWASHEFCTGLSKICTTILIILRAFVGLLATDDDDDDDGGGGGGGGGDGVSSPDWVIFVLHLPPLLCGEGK
jgi:hypothetical protein